MNYSGLSEADVVKSLADFGENVLTPPPRDSLLKLFLEKLKDPIIIILVVATGISCISGEWVESLGILLAIILSTGIAFFSEYRAGKTFDILNAAEEQSAVKVIRAGGCRSIPKSEVVVGDIILLEMGEEVPADCEVLEQSTFAVDQSKFTGEPEPVEKFPQGSPEALEAANDGSTYPIYLVLRGSMVLQGNATVRVVAVGDATEIGKTSRAATEQTNLLTPLQRQLQKLGKTIAWFGFGASAILFTILGWNLYQSGAIGNLSAWLGVLMVVVTLIVVTVPEGLPMSVTLSLACAMRRMSASNVLVRKMHACETIGAATVICTDKTGTLTMNQMTVSKVVFVDEEMVPEAFAVNATAHLNQGQVIGNPTEGALLKALEADQIDFERVREQFSVIEQVPFSSEKKRMSTAGHSHYFGHALWHHKGAPEAILGDCSLCFTGKHMSVTMDEARRQQIAREIATEQAKGARVLGFAVEKHAASEGMIWAGYVVIADPVRPDVADAVKACQQAGIDIKIVTGDTCATAGEIGRQAGIAQSGEGIIEGKDFEKLSDEETLEFVKSLKIIARARPQDKQKLVKALQANHQVVAVTGDGTNDAPALNHADVGISMGITGTSVAREAADIILLDDSFMSITNAVLWGRSLYLNIQRFLVFQLTINIAAATIALMGPMLGVQLPFTVIQMLWINLIMDTFAALALATEPPTPETMTQQPRDPHVFIVTKAMAVRIVLTALAVIAAFLGFYFWMRDPTATAPLDGKALTYLFNGFVLTQVWNLMHVRTMGSGKHAFAALFTNGAFLLILVGIVILQILMTQFGGEIFRVEALSMTEWSWTLLASSLIFWLSEAVAILTQTRNRK